MRPANATTPTRGGAGALLPAARLWRRTLAKGAAYLAGRFGGVRVLILPKRDDEAGDHTRVLCFADPGPAAPPCSNAEGGR